MISLKTIYKMENFLKEEVAKNKRKGVVFGLSGGIDSAVVAAISKRAFKDEHLALLLPIFSSDKDEEDAMLIIEKFGINYKKCDLKKSFETIIKDLGAENFSDLAISNIKPRLRMTSLYLYAQQKSYLVIGTSNKSEYEIGYFTKYADSACDLYLLKDFYKSEVYELAKYLDIPERIIQKKPSAGLYEGQSDEEDMGFSYDVLEKYLRGEYVDEKIKEIIKKRVDMTEHKRREVPYFKNILE